MHAIVTVRSVKMYHADMNAFQISYFIQNARFSMPY